MTAKKLAEKAADWMESQSGNGITKELVGYYFTPDVFQTFCETLCREQRENVLKACKFSSDGQYFYAANVDILNATMPEI